MTRGAERVWRERKGGIQIYTGTSIINLETEKVDPLASQISAGFCGGLNSSSRFAIRDLRAEYTVCVLEINECPSPLFKWMSWAMRVGVTNDSDSARPRVFSKPWWRVAVTSRWPQWQANDRLTQTDLIAIMCAGPPMFFHPPTSLFPAALNDYYLSLCLSRLRDITLSAACKRGSREKQTLK